MELREFLANAAAAAPTRPVAPSVGFAQGGVTPAKLGPYWFHQISEEMRAVLVAASIDGLSTFQSKDVTGSQKSSRVMLLPLVPPRLLALELLAPPLAAAPPDRDEVDVTAAVCPPPPPPPPNAALEPAVASGPPVD